MPNSSNLHYRRRGAGHSPSAPLTTYLLLYDRTYAVAFRRGMVEGRRSSTNRLLPAGGGRAVGVAPGRLAAAGGKRGMRGGFASPPPLHRVSPVIGSALAREGRSMGCADASAFVCGAARRPSNLCSHR